MATLALVGMALSVGVAVGVLVAALCFAAKDRDDREQAYWRGFRRGAMSDESYGGHLWSVQ